MLHEIKNNAARHRERLTPEQDLSRSDVVAPKRVGSSQLARNAPDKCVVVERGSLIAIVYVVLHKLLEGQQLKAHVDTILGEPFLVKLQRIWVESCAGAIAGQSRP